jgi:hypothetical protein
MAGSEGGGTSTETSCQALGAKGPVFPANPSAGLTSHGPVADSIRKLPVALSTLSAWIATNAEGGTCVLASLHHAVKGAYGLGMSCAPAAVAKSGTFLELQTEGSDVGTVVGAVPDGVSAVEVTLGNGTNETVPVTDNASALEGDAQVESTHDVVVA